MARMRWRRIWLTGAAVFALLLVTAVVVLQSAWFRGWLGGLAVRQIAAAIDGDIEIDRLSGSLLRDVTLHGIRISQGGRPLFSAETIEARYDPLQLIAGRWSIDRLDIHQPNIALAQDPRGWNVARLVRVRANAGPSAPWSIALKGIAIDGGDVQVTPLAGPQLHFRDVALRGDATIGRDGVDVALGRGTWRDVRSGHVITASRGRLRTDKDGLRLDDVAVDTAAMSARGMFARPNDPSGRVSLTIEADLRGWTPALLAPYVEHRPDFPPLTGTVAAQGRSDALRLEWALSSPAGKTTGAFQTSLGGSGVRAQGPLTMDHLNPAAFLPGEGLDGDLTGTLDVDASVTLTDVVASRVSFALRDLHGRWFGYRADALNGRGEWRDDAVRFAGHGRAYGATATFNVAASRVSQRSRVVTIGGIVQHVNLAHLPARLGAPALTSDISGRYDVSVATGEWRAEVAAARSSIDGATIHDGTVVCASALGPSLTLQMDGTVSNISGGLLRLPLDKPTALSGHVRGDVTFADTRRMTDIESIQGTIVAAFDDSTLMGVGFSHAVVDASASRGILDIRQLEAQAPALAVTASGRVALEPGSDTASDLRFSVDTDDLSALDVFGAPALRGGAHVEGTVTGPARRPHIEGTYSGQEVGYADLTDALTLDGAVAVDLPERDPAQAVVSGSLVATFIRVRGTELRQVAMTAKYVDRVLDLQGHIDQSGRSLEFEGGVAFQPEFREIRLRALTLGGLGMPWSLAQGVQPVVRYGTDRVEIKDLALARGAERLAAEGLIALGTVGPSSDVSLSLEGIQVGDAYQLLAGEPRVTGTASGEMRLRGRLDNPTVDGTLKVMDGAAMSVPFTVVETTLAVADKRAALEGYIDEPNGNRLLVKGVIPTSADAGAMDLRVSTDHVSLGLIQAFTSELQDVQGTLAIDAHLTGALTAPAIDGQASLTDGAVRVAATGVQYVRIHGDVAFDGTDVHVNQFSLEDDDGHALTVTGTGAIVAREGKRSVDVQVRSDDIHLLRNQLGDLEVSANLYARGDLEAPRITGDVRVNRGRIEVDQILRGLGVTPAAVSEASITGSGMAGVPPTVAARVLGDSPSTTPGQPPAPTGDAATPSADPDALYGRTAMDVRLVLPDNVVLRGTNIKTSSGSVGLGDMNLTVGGTVMLRKTTGADLEAIGAIEVIRGFYQFQGRRFDVERGSTVDFRTGDLTDPRVNVAGTRDVSGVTARVHVTGTAQRPVVTLSSQPPLDEGDVLSLIVFNQPMNQLGESEQIDLVQRAGDLALSAVAGSVADSIGRAFNVDLFEIRVPSADRTGEVAVGNQVSERIFVGFRQQFGDASASRLSVEYRISQALRLLTTFGQGAADRESDAHVGGTAGLDLFYTLRY